MSINRKIGKRISPARKEAELTQGELAKLLNLSRTSVVNIEKGKQACSVEKLIVVSRLTGYSIDTLIGFEGGKELPEIENFKRPYSLHKELDRIPEKHLRAYIGYYNKTSNNTTEEEC